MIAQPIDRRIVRIVGVEKPVAMQGAPDDLVEDPQVIQIGQVAPVVPQTGECHQQNIQQDQDGSRPLPGIMHAMQQAWH